MGLQVYAFDDQNHALQVFVYVLLAVQDIGPDVYVENAHVVKIAVADKVFDLPSLDVVL